MVCECCIRLLSTKKEVGSFSFSAISKREIERFVALKDGMHQVACQAHVAMRGVAHLRH